MDYTESKLNYNFSKSKLNRGEAQSQELACDYPYHLIVCVHCGMSLGQANCSSIT